MAAPTNTVTTVNNIGIREDLENDIYRIAPEKTPFTSNIGKVKASNTFHEWQTETIEAVDASNFQLEGDDIATLDSARLTTRWLKDDTCVPGNPRYPSCLVGEW